MSCGVSVSVFAHLRNAPYGAYAVDLNQTIVFWNLEAERMLGYSASDVIGRKCYEVLLSVAENGTQTCVKNCPAVYAAAHGHTPPISSVRMRCASGQRKQMAVFPIIMNAQKSRLILIHLFHETHGDDFPHLMSTQSLLTRRETEVLSLLAAGLRVSEVAGQFVISVHTVRKHVSNASKKLGTNGMMSSVLEARRQHLI